ncbi:DNA repair exonuclease [Candidatus Woesearchaeota archaeon]|nr:DNA repair exonuclease [Candidatus Woesearchaeota archaeon]
MRFIHVADCHLDGFREEKLSKLGFQNFIYIIDKCIEEDIDFLIIAGDLFNSALPRIDVLKQTIAQLRRLQHNEIPVYFIPGSHDFSPQGRSMLEIIELAGLGHNVMKGEVDEEGKLHLNLTIDKKTSCQLVGIQGKKGMLDKKYYEQLAPITIDKSKPSVFLFHTSITQLKPKELDKMESYDATLLPPNFDYYAGGHVHITEEITHPTNPKAHITYPGPTFPNSFSELEKLKEGYYILYDNENGSEVPWKRVSIPSKRVLSLNFDANNLTPHQVEENLLSEIEKLEVSNSIVLLRFVGTLIEGKTTDIDFKNIFRELYDNGAYTVLKNTHNLTSKIFEENQSDHSLSAKEIEEDAIKEHLNQFKLPENLNEQEVISELLRQLDQEPIDGEKKHTFNDRIIEQSKLILEK